MDRRGRGGQRKRIRAYICALARTQESASREEDKDGGREEQTDRGRQTEGVTTPSEGVVALQRE